MSDIINHPTHYCNHPSGVECITIAEHHNFNIGNAIKYLWRAGFKVKSLQGELTDLKKAGWYIQREIQRLEALADSNSEDPKGFKDGDCNHNKELHANMGA